MGHVLGNQGCRQKVTFQCGSRPRQSEGRSRKRHPPSLLPEASGACPTIEPMLNRLALAFADGPPAGLARLRVLAPQPGEGHAL
jgi:hypothetical protein